MKSIYPPSGEQDAERYSTLTKEERSYMWYALEFCGAVLSRRSEHIEALELAANHLTALGYYADGLRLDRRLALIKPGEPGVLYNLACSLALTGNHGEALDTLSRAVEAGYSDFRHMSEDCDLAPLRNEERFLSLIAQAPES
jgi:hypothetical protein